ncbi:MAG TPA: hypothetical protein VF168_00505 [Trueperaceae bacterium]
MPPTLEVLDLSPRFLQFYADAVAKDLDPENRWELWKSVYGFAAVPPTPAGQVRARQLLDEAWDRYPTELDRIRRGAEGLSPEPSHELHRVAELLECETDAKLRVIVFVGGFEGNPFVADIEGMTTLSLPIEQSPEERAFMLPHEVTHVIHGINAGMAMTWERSIARIVMEEGLATRVTEKLIPGHEAERYTTDHDPELYELCTANESEILDSVRTCLHTSDSATVERFTMGAGAAGLSRTAYYAGWRVVGALTAAGWSLASLSKVPEARIPAVIDSGLDLLSSS